jgi:general secretion pathway protein D
MFNMTLGALITDGKAKVLSAPKVTTINNEEAKLLAGEKMPFKTTTIGPGGVSQEAWSYVDVGVKLTVKPTITKGGSVRLKVHPEVSVPSAIAAEGAPPPVRTREIEVTVMVEDADTLVIGGLIGENDIETISKVPLLGDLPILGYFFKYKEKTKARSELLVFITPKILKE